MTRWIAVVVVLVALGCGERGEGDGPAVDAGPSGDADPCAGCVVACDGFDGLVRCERDDAACFGCHVACTGGGATDDSSCTGLDFPSCLDGSALVCAAD